MYLTTKTFVWVGATWLAGLIAVAVAGYILYGAGTITRIAGIPLAITLIAVIVRSLIIEWQHTPQEIARMSLKELLSKMMPIRSA